MRLKKLLLPIILSSTALLCVTGCGKEDKIGGSNKIQIKVYKGGYGTDFLHQMAKKFRTIYPEISFEFLDESSLMDGEKAVSLSISPRPRPRRAFPFRRYRLYLLVTRSRFVG